MTNKEKEILQMFIDDKLDYGTSIWLIQDPYQHPRCEAEIYDIRDYDRSLYIGWVQYDRNYEEPDEVWDEGDIKFEDFGETWVLDFDIWKQKMKEKYNFDWDKQLEEFMGQEDMW